MKSNRLKIVTVTIILNVLSIIGFAQKIISEQDAVALAVKNSGEVGARDFQVQQNRHLQKAAISIPNPEIIAESPTGEFYAVGILQSLDFPTVYAQQAKFRKQMTRLSERQKDATVHEVARLIRTIYLNAQYTRELVKQLSIQDSIYSTIATSAQRQFAAGTIDYLAKTFAETQAGEIHNERLQADAEHRSWLQQLALYTGSKEPIMTTDLLRTQIEEKLLRYDTTAAAQNPMTQYYQQAIAVNKASLSLERNRALPGVVFGFLNQGARETDTYFRFRVGFTLPIWFWQYSGNIKAAKTAVAAAESDLKAQRQNLSAELLAASNNVLRLSSAVEYYESTGVNHADDIIRTARRLFDSGQNDYLQYLRNSNEAFVIKRRYLQALRDLKESVLTLNYLNGTL